METMDVKWSSGFCNGCIMRVSVSVQAEETTETEEAAETDSSAESEDDLQILLIRQLKMR